MRTLDQPPSGRCAMCHEPAAKWIGTIDTLADGRQVTRAVGVCEACFDRFTAGSGSIEPPEFT